MDLPAPLAVTARPRLRLAAGVVAAAAAVGAVASFVSSPAALSTSSDPVLASTPAGTPVHVGVFTPAADFDRTLDLSGVRVRVSSDAPVQVEPLLCRGGSFRVTTVPEVFCDELTGTEGVALGAGDSVVLRVAGDQPGTATIERVRLVFRDGLQRGVRPAGAPSEVVVLPR